MLYFDFRKMHYNTALYQCKACPGLQVAYSQPHVLHATATILPGYSKLLSTSFVSENTYMTFM